MNEIVTIGASETQGLIDILKARFDKNKALHPKIEWDDVELKIKSNPQKLKSLMMMEDTGGEPDVVVFDEDSTDIFFVDCSAESPSGRRSLCYDRAGWESRKDFRPENTAIDLANEMLVELLSESEYRKLQQYKRLDTKTSSWILTPESYRKLGGALFSEFRYGAVFVYHNGAQSYYAARGFRAKLKL